MLEAGDWRALSRNGPFLRLLGFCAGAQFFLHGPMVLFPVYVRSLGGDIQDVSRMWLLMIAVEIPLIVWSQSWLKRLGARGLIGLGVCFGGVRWLVCGFATELWQAALVQPLHGLVVAGLLMGGPLYADAIVPDRLRSTGQGMLAMFAMSLGGFASSIASGWLLERFGPHTPYLIGGVGAGLLGLTVPRWLPPPTTPASLTVPRVACVDAPSDKD